MKRIALWSLTVCTAVLLSGCIKSKQHWTIYPDGSGKVEVENTLMGMMAQMVKMGGQMGPGAEGGEAKDPLDMIRESVKGKVYWTQLETEDGPGGEFILRGVAYFDNIADVNTGEEGQNSVEWKKNADGTYTLVMTNEDAAEGLPGLPPGMGGEDGDEENMSPEQKAQQQQMKAMMMGMLAGFEVSISFTGPGAAQAIEGFQAKDGRTATFRLGEEDVKKMMNKQLKPPTKMSATFAAPGEGFDAEFAAFKKALAEAKKNAQAQGGDDKDEEGDSEGGKKDDEGDSEGGKGGTKAF